MIKIPTVHMLTSAFNRHTNTHTQIITHASPGSAALLLPAANVVPVNGHGEL